MGLLKIFKGGIKLGAGLQPKGDFPLMEAHDIVVEEVTDENGELKGIRLDEKLKNIGAGVKIDATLKEEGQAADAKAVGDKIATTLGDIHSVLKRI